LGTGNPPALNRTFYGDGELLYVASQAAGTPTAYAHDLGRIPTFVMILTNGTAFKGDAAITAATATSVTINNEVALTGAIVFIV
jgi:hypothetical protein